MCFPRAVGGLRTQIKCHDQLPVRRVTDIVMVDRCAQPRLKGTIFEGHEPDAPEASSLARSGTILEFAGEKFPRSEWANDKTIR
jgi:hypothetical protein